MRQAINNVNIEGILNEVDLAVKVDKDNREFISGKVIFIVNQTCSGKPETEEVAVNVFAYKLTKAGKNNPAYESALTLLNTGVSVAACGSEDLMWFILPSAPVSLIRSPKISLLPRLLNRKLSLVASWMKS